MSAKPEGQEVQAFIEKLKREAEEAGYHINPDTSVTYPVAEGLLINSKRYGYPLCPCRMSGGSREEDLDIICPCDYRDDDLDEYDACY